VFERFGDGANSVIARAREEAHRLGHPHVGTEHLLVGILAEGESGAAGALTAAGATLGAASHKVAEAVGRSTGGALAAATAADLPLTPRAHRALERAVRLALQRRAAVVDPEHVLLGVLAVEGTAGQVLRRLGVDLGRLRDAVDAIAAGETSDESVPSGAARPPVAEPRAPRCPECDALLDGALTYQVVAAGQKRERRDFVIAYCGECGRALGAAPA